MRKIHFLQIALSYFAVEKFENNYGSPILETHLIKKLKRQTYVGWRLMETGFQAVISECCHLMIGVTQTVSV